MQCVILCDGIVHERNYIPLTLMRLVKVAIRAEIKKLITKSAQELERETLPQQPL